MERDYKHYYFIIRGADSNGYCIESNYNWCGYGNYRHFRRELIPQFHHFHLYNIGDECYNVRIMIGGMMDKLEVIIKSYCEIMILLEYGDEKARDNVLYENLKIENGQEEIIKRKYVQEKLNGKKRDGSHI